MYVVPIREELPTDWSVLIGDAVHNARSELDYVSGAFWWTTEALSTSRPTSRSPISRPATGIACERAAWSLAGSPILAGAGDFDLELLESRTLDGRTQELVYRPALR